MLKVKVEPVEPTLYGKVSLPNNPLTIAGYQVFCNDEERHDEKVPKLIDHVDDDEVHVGGRGSTDDGGIEGADRMMTECCGESDDIMVGDLGSESGVKVDEEDGLHMGEYVENDVMVDNNIVEEQVVEDGMVLVSHQHPQDGIELPYMETAPTEVLVIEEGAELMVDNIHGLPHMIMEEDNREYLITTEHAGMAESEGRTEVLMTESEEQAIVGDEALEFNEPEHVVVERINYEMPIIQSSDASQYFLQQEEQTMEPDTEVVLDMTKEVPIPAIPRVDKLSSNKTQKGRKLAKQEGKALDSAVKKKKAAKRRADEAGVRSEEQVKQPQSNGGKVPKRRKSGQSEAKSQQLLTTPKQDKSSNANEKSERLSPIQANHPTLSLLLSKIGPMELYGPAPTPLGAVRKQLFTESAPLTSTSSSTMHTITINSVSSTVKPKSVAANSKASVTAPESALPQIVMDINEEEEIGISSVVPSPTQAPMQKVPKMQVKVKHSKNNNKHVSLPIAAQDLSITKSNITLSPIHALLTVNTLPEAPKMTTQPVSVKLQKSTSSKPLTQVPIARSVKLTTPLTVAVADTLAIASLPTVKPASLLTVPKPLRRLSIDMVPSPAAKSSLVVTSPPIASVPTISPAPRAPVTSPLSIAVPPTATVSMYTASSGDTEELVSPIQKKYQMVTTTLQARLATKPNTSAPNGMDTLADRYMKEWKPTGRFQCKLCLYSCVTHNFLFRHWVLNHCSLRPYMCGHCGFQSATRDGVTRHQTAKHQGLARRIFIDNEQQELLWNKFDEMFQGSGFVTELERQGQASYTLGNATKVQEREFQDRLAAASAASRDKEMVGSTILKVPKRDGVGGKFREVILLSEDDIEVGSSQESWGEEEEEEVVHHVGSPAGVVSSKTYKAHQPVFETAAAAATTPSSASSIMTVVAANLDKNNEFSVKKENSKQQQQQQQQQKKTIFNKFQSEEEEESEKIYKFITSGTSTAAPVVSTAAQDLGHPATLSRDGALTDDFDHMDPSPPEQPTSSDIPSVCTQDD